MKISKKILGVALVITLILNVFAVGAFAADDTLVELGIATDKATYKQGETVVITFSAKCLPELGSLQIGGQYEIGYNSAVLEPSSDATTDIIAHGFTEIQKGALTGNASIQMPASSSGPSALYDWNTTICYCFPDDGTKFDATAGADLFSIKMKIKADAPAGTYTIGFNPAGYEECNGYINDSLGLGGLYGMSATDYGFSVPTMYGFGTCTFTVEGGSQGPVEPSEPTITIENLDTKVRWATTEEDSRSNVLLVGFEGKLTGVKKENVSSTISAIGFKFSTSDKTLDENGVLKNGTLVKTLVVYYDFTADAANTYKFRSIVCRPLAATDVDDNTENDTESLNIYAQAFVTIGDTTSYASGIIDTTLKAEYDQGVANKMEDRFPQ